MIDSTQDELRLARTDLDVASAALMTRFHTSIFEDVRVSDMRNMLLAAADLVGALGTFTQHGAVHFRQTSGTSDLASDAEFLFVAMTTWVGAVRDISVRYAGSLPSHQPSRQLPLGG